MSDFLTTIATRNAGVAPQVTPRPRARFEHEGPALASSTLDEIAGEEPVAQTQPAVSAVRASPRGRSESDVASDPDGGDFLPTIATRNAGVAPQVTPRPQARFEHEGPALATSALDEIAGEEPVAQSRPVVSAVRASPRGRSESDVASDPDGGDIPPEPGGEITPAAGRAQRPIGTSVEPSDLPEARRDLVAPEPSVLTVEHPRGPQFTPPEPDLGSTDSPAGDRPRPPASPAIPGPAEARRAVSVAPPKLIANRPPAPAMATDPVRMPPPVARDSVAASSAPQPANDRTPTRPAPPPEVRTVLTEPVVAVTRLHPAPAAEATMTTARVAPEPMMPTIQVTIGRVEIRAQPAVARPQRVPAGRAAVMPLDEYLRRGRGGP